MYLLEQDDKAVLRAMGRDFADKSFDSFFCSNRMPIIKNLIFKNKKEISDFIFEDWGAYAEEATYILEKDGWIRDSSSKYHCSYYHEKSLPFKIFTEAYVSRTEERLVAHDDLKTYLTVPYAEKDEVKKRGAKWDAVNKKWFAPFGMDKSNFRPWM